MVCNFYFQMTKTNESWYFIAKQFNDKWNFPNCVGAMDGKHISIQAPINSGTDFFNYKSFFSIVLFAVVDANYNFIYANVGCQGRISDGGVFNDSYFKECLEENTLNLPPACSLLGRSTDVPFVFVADDAFPLSTNIMKPFAGHQEKGSKNRIFNYRLSRARRVSENAFGILSAVFRVLRRPMLLEPETATNVVLALIHLHNFLRKNTSRNLYTPPGMIDVECSDTGAINPGLWKRNASSNELFSFGRRARRSGAAAQNVRNELAEFFISQEGALPFQYDK
ncbi:uncharacterized protein LOC126880978 [Diabrotica virgifera virgifera]|uniref:DDE Tnp4 domain-containing protein n=1 Tax=Diabrotica virgifera virgifera TaxID=50390 RepID=A0ABM5JSU7_DIAVI|nr:uncharacterized protein LOC126880978 [Diabrotica virgifera virgifera]